MKAYFPPFRSLVLFCAAIAAHASCTIIINSELEDKPLSTTSSSGDVGGSGNGGGAGGNGAGGMSAGGGGTGGMGGCATTCQSGETCCADTCFSLQTDAKHCGNCDTSCSGTEKCCGGSCAECCDSTECPTADYQCISGTCVLMCTMPAVMCGMTCATLDSDSKNCGACGNDCLSGHACVGSVCQSGWATMSTNGALSPRQRAAAAWTGSLLFVWGGQDTTGVLGDGALYDPATDTWTPLPMTNAPSARTDAVAVAMNGQVLVWGGGLDTSTAGFNSGKRYDLATSTWLDVAIAPIGRRFPVAVWTGSKALLWGGMSGGAGLAGGATYDPATNSWKVITNSNAPSSRIGIGATWSGTELLLFGGRPGGTGSTNEGYGYNPKTDTWRKFATTGAPTSRFDTFAAWTGTSMLVFGGRDGSGTNNDAALYDPSTDSWKAAMTNPVKKRSAPVQRTGWISSGMPKIFVIGGLDENQALKVDAGVYDSTVNDWGAQIPDWPSGVDHEYGVAVWTGVEFILWSGLDNSVLNSAGERYRP